MSQSESLRLLLKSAENEEKLRRDTEYGLEQLLLYQEFRGKHNFLCNELVAPLPEAQAPLERLKSLNMARETRKDIIRRWRAAWSELQIKQVAAGGDSL